MVISSAVQSPGWRSDLLAHLHFRLINSCKLLSTNTHSNGLKLFVEPVSSVPLPTTKALFPQLPSLLSLSHCPFSPFPSPISSIPLLSRSGPLKPAIGGLGERCQLLQWGLGQSPSRHRFWCILRTKNSFDSNYYMAFSVMKFGKLVIKSPQEKNCPWRIFANGR